MTKNSLPAEAQARVRELRARHPRFFYDGFSLERQDSGLCVQYQFRIEPDLSFTPQTTLENVDWRRVEQIPQALLENLVFHLGLIEMLSYWKAACSPEMVVRAGVLTPEQVAWWTDLLRKGMGEYFCVNRIDFLPVDFLRIVSARSSTSSAVIPSEQGESRDLLFPFDRRSSMESPRRPVEGGAQRLDAVLVSGGKDSVVTLETLRAAGRSFDCVLLNPTQAALDIAKQAGCEQPIIVRRTIDPRLLELNAAGYLNGHTPFSALLAFLGVTVAALFGHGRVMVSNERSAEEATVEYLGEPINHQYSKTFQFESAFRKYSQTYLTPDIEYFSLLRPLYELQIAQRFAQYPEYFSLFRSCNRGQSTNSWCGRCPKCLFVYTALYPFLEREQILGIFRSAERHADLFAWEGAAEVLRALLGLDKEKPFECVGTREETLAAVHWCIEKHRAQGIALPAALETIQETALSARTDVPQLTQRILTSWTDQHFLPLDISNLLRVR